MLLIRMVREKEKKKAGCGQISVGEEWEFAPGYYAAVDIGTTTLAVELYDAQGQYLGGRSEENAQRILGSDVMMRLMHVQEGRGERLIKLIRDQIRRVLRQLIEEIETDRGQVHGAGGCLPVQRMAIVGNTVMCHLFLGQDVQGLCGAPFRAAYRGSFHAKGSDLGWAEYAQTDILVLPGIEAHVGADAAAVMGVQRLWQPDRIQLAIDLGTNAEILWNDHGQLYACSTAAGPAFEGIGMRCGCMAGPGAVSAVRIMKGNGNILLDIIPDSGAEAQAVTGLCGSGLIDLIASLRQSGMLLPDGRLLTKEEALCRCVLPVLAERLQRDADGQMCFLVFDPACDKAGKKGSRDKKILLSQEDIRAFQMAKAAIQAGVAVLCRETGRELSEITECQIAGMFGYSIQVRNAISCGLLPGLPEEKFQFIGNAAGRGAAQALFDPGFVQELEQKAGRVKHIELAQAEGFQRMYMEGMALQPAR